MKTFTRPNARRMVLLLASIALLEAACSRPPEQQLLTQYFRAARSRDNTTAALMSTVTLDPRNQGSVESFDIVSIEPEQRSKADFSALIEAERQAVLAEQNFQREKKAYSDAHLQTIEEILKLEGDPNAKLTREQAEVKPVWDKWRADTATFVKAISDAERALLEASSPAEASLSQPGQPKFDAKQFDGDAITEEIRIKANFSSPTGETSERDLVVTMTRFVGTQGGQQRDGRWIITNIDGLP